MSAWAATTGTPAVVASVWGTLAEAERAAGDTGDVWLCEDTVRPGDVLEQPSPGRPGRPRIGRPLTLRLSPEDRARVGELRERWGLSSDAEAIRWAIRHAGPE